MEESVFFNKGNAISSTVDLKDLYETAQIEKYRGLNEKLVIVQKKNGQNTCYSIKQTSIN